MFWTKIINTLVESIAQYRNAKEHIKHDLEAHRQKSEVTLDRVKLEYHPENNENPQHEVF